MADKLMNNPNDDTQNYPYGRLNIVVEKLNLIIQPTKIH